jgi:hypothetical protein
VELRKLIPILLFPNAGHVDPRFPFSAIDVHALMKKELMSFSAEVKLQVPLGGRGKS